MSVGGQGLFGDVAPRHSVVNATAGGERDEEGEKGTGLTCFI